MADLRDQIRVLVRAVELAPFDAALLNALGDCYHMAKQYGLAVAAYTRAVKIVPKLVGTWYSMGCAQTSMGAFAAAVVSLRRALALDAGKPEFQHNLGRALFEIGQADEAMEWFWKAAQLSSSALPLTTMAVIAPGVPGCGNADLLKLRRLWAERCLPVVERPIAATLGGRLRIGYLSSFFHRPNWMKPVWGLINQHDRERFEVCLFSDAAMEGGYVPRAGDQVHDISKLSNEQAAEVIRGCKLDLLIDLNSFSAPERLPLLAMRPAGRIAAWFNLYATSGMPCFDYLIGDSTVIPASEDSYYCEKIVRVAGSYLTFDVSYSVPDVSDRAGACEIVFGCLASQHKINNDVVAAWSRILLGAPASRLIVKNATLGAADVREFLLGRFVAHGVDAGRVQIEGPAEHHEFLQTYGEIDVALDTFPYNGGTTTTEALWQGVPVVTFLGDRWASRTSASILRAAGLDEFVRGSVDEYVDYAISLAG